MRKHREPFTRKYIHFNHPEVRGVYYQDGNVLYHNLDSQSGKLIVMVPAIVSEKARAMR